VLRAANVPQDILDIPVRWANWTGGVFNAIDPQSEEGKTNAALAKQAAVEVPIVITYISRQEAKYRRLEQADHEALVKALEELCKRRQWELNAVFPEKLSREEQWRIAARTTILLGVHGNGLTHLLTMPLTPITAVIEMFFPKGYARDYQWTANALNMKHFGIWNDSYVTYPELPYAVYPEGFHDFHIPVHAPFVVSLIEDWVGGQIP